MKEYGGYIEFETFHGKMLHDNAVALNCGRGALEYICEAKKIRKLYLPHFLCSSVPNLCNKIGVGYSYYSINERFEPVFNLTLGEDEWIYIVNFYGQLNNDYLIALKRKYDRIIVDNAQSYFQMPAEGVDTLYTCRKYFGVADGAFCIPIRDWNVNFCKMNPLRGCIFLLDALNVVQMSFTANMWRTISCFPQSR